MTTNITPLIEAKIAQRFYETHKSFQSKICRLADVSGMTPIAVYTMWLDYSRQCESFDQSAMLEEFIVWRQPELNPTAMLDLRSAIA